MKRIQVQDVYDLYPLYKLLYGRSEWWYHAQAQLINQMVEDWAFRYGNGTKSRLKLLELFSGQSELKRPLLHALSLPKELYVETELRHWGNRDKSGNKIYGDAYNPKFADAIAAKATEVGGLNVVLLPYCSINSTYPVGQTSHSHESLVNLFNNCRVAFNDKPGMLYLHLDTGPQTEKEIQDSLGEYVLSQHVPSMHSLREELGIGTHARCHVTYSTENSYVRSKAHSISTIHNLTVFVSDKAVAKVKVKDPIVQTYWTDSEVCHALRTAGFDELHWYQNVEGSIHDGDLNLIEIPDLATEEWLEASLDKVTGPRHLVAYFNPKPGKKAVKRNLKAM